MDKELSILIVDDNPRARNGLSAFISMQKESAVVCEASNGEEALAKIESQHPDLVLMDLQMPVMDGLDATRAIKERWPKIKVIILTIYADGLSRAQQAGADAFLVKGFPMEELLSMVRGVMEPDQEGNATRSGSW